MDKAGHGELGARRRSMTMAAMAMAHRPLPWLELRQWRVGEVEEVMAERCARAIGQWRGGSSERARRRCGGDSTALWFARRARERKREARQRRVSA